MVELNGNIELLGKGKKKKKKTVYRKVGGFNSGVNRKVGGYNSGTNKVRNAGTYYKSTDPNFNEYVKPYSFYKTGNTATQNFIPVKNNQATKINNSFINPELYQTGITNYIKNTKKYPVNNNQISEYINNGIDDVVETTQEVTQDAVETVKETATNIWDTVTGFMDKYKWWLIGGGGVLLLIYLITATKGGQAVYESYFPPARTVRRRR